MTIRMGKAGAAGVIVALAVCGILVDSPTAGPSRYGFSDRVERHLFPEVTTGPAEPAWSPDGRRIAFSMQGDIWKVPAEGGEAIAITRGPAYHFEPAWSPDGRMLALTLDASAGPRGNLDIGVVAADGGEVTRLTTEASADLQPAWSRDGRALYFASSRGRGFDIFRMDLPSRAVVAVAAGAGDQIQPAVSPDGRTLAYVSPVAGRLGTGGIWTRPIDGTGEPALAHYEESEYRMRPAWLPDGSGWVFVSDEAGSNDVARVASDGGNAVRLTADSGGEFSPAVSPDGARAAFISNRGGPMTLEVASIGGGPVSSFRRVPIASRRAMTPTGSVRGRVVDEAGREMPARIQLVAADGRAYAPDDGFARVMAVTESHYFHTSGAFEVTVPAGDLRITALRGFEYTPVEARVAVTASGAHDVTLRLSRGIDMPALGWYSGDTHAHDLHQGRFGLTHRTLFDQSLAEDLHVTNVLIHMDGTRLMGRWEDLTGEPHPLSTPTHVMQFSEEFRGGLGHIGMLGLNRYILPLIGGAPNTPYAQPASDAPYLDGARAQGGISGFMHPYIGAVSDDPARWAGSLIPVDVALGKGDFYDVASLYSDETTSAYMYHRLLNAGFKLAATGGTDNFPDVWRDPPPGTDRTYAKIEGPLSLASWMAAVKAGRTIATTGPLVFLDVEGRGPGETLALPAGAPETVTVRVRTSAFVEASQVRVLVNGTGAVGTVGDIGSGGFAALPLRHRTHEQVFSVSIPDGGWIAVEVTGPPSRFLCQRENRGREAGTGATDV